MRICDVCHGSEMVLSAKLIDSSFANTGLKSSNFDYPSVQIDVDLCCDCRKASSFAELIERVKQ